MHDKESMQIETSRFWLRPLTERDATKRYLSWLSNTSSKFIETAKDINALADLEAYILEKVSDEKVLLYGIFEKISEQHIGNIKYEPIDSGAGVATMGILLGESDFLGKGVASEVIIASAQYLKSKYNIERIALGVDLDNVQAIRAYEKIGFLADDSPRAGNNNFRTQSMVWTIF